MAQNLIKSNLRSTLTQTNMQILMRVKIEGPVLEDFDPSEAIGHWLTSGKGTRHVAQIGTFSRVLYLLGLSRQVESL